MIGTLELCFLIAAYLFGISTGSFCMTMLLSGEDGGCFFRLVGILCVVAAVALMIVGITQP